jgi:hypothetical protein
MVPLSKPIKVFIKTHISSLTHIDGLRKNTKPKNKAVTEDKEGKLILKER